MLHPAADASSQFFLSTMNTSKSAYASFRFATNRFFGRYQFQGSGQFQEKFFCSMYIRVRRLSVDRVLLSVQMANPPSTLGTGLSLPQQIWRGVTGRRGQAGHH